MRTAASLVGGWAVMLVGAYLLTMASLPGRVNGSLMAFVIGVSVVAPAVTAVTLLGLLLAALLRPMLKSDLCAAVTAAWTSTAIVVVGLVIR